VCDCNPRHYLLLATGFLLLVTTYGLCLVTVPRISTPETQEFNRLAQRSIIVQLQMHVLILIEGFLGETPKQVTADDMLCYDCAKRPEGRCEQYLRCRCKKWGECSNYT